MFLRRCFSFKSKWMLVKRLLNEFLYVTLNKNETLRLYTSSPPEHCNNVHIKRYFQERMCFMKVTKHKSTKEGYLKYMRTNSFLFSSPLRTHSLSLGFFSHIYRSEHHIRHICTQKSSAQTSFYSRLLYGYIIPGQLLKMKHYAG